MKTLILSKTQQELTGANIAIVCDYADVTAATSGVAVNALSVLAGTKVQCVGMKMTEVFDRAAGTAVLAVTLGDGGAANSLQASTVLGFDGTEIYYHVGGSAKVYLVDDTVDVFFTDGGSMTYEQGVVTFYLAVQDQNAWPIS